MDSMSTEARPTGRADIVLRPLDDGWVLFDPQATQLHVLNLSAALVWVHCDGDCTVQGMADTIARVFDPPISSSQALDDVSTAVARFREAGLLE